MNGRPTPSSSGPARSGRPLTRSVIRPHPPYPRAGSTMARRHGGFERRRRGAGTNWWNVAVDPGIQSQARRTMADCAEPSYSSRVAMTFITAVCPDLDKIIAGRSA